MRRALPLAVLLLPLAACYAPPGPGYGPQPYGYAQPYGYQTDAYDGYDYNGGSPYMTYDGAQVPLIFYGGYWGFYDNERRFHRAPDSVGRQLESRHPRGAGVTTYGGGRTPAPAYGGGSQVAPRPQYRQNTAAPPYTAPPVHTPPPVHTAAPVHTAPPPARTAPPQRHEEHHDRTCPQGQSRC